MHSSHLVCERERERDGDGRGTVAKWVGGDYGSYAMGTSFYDDGIH